MKKLQASRMTELLQDYVVQPSKNRQLDVPTLLESVSVQPPPERLTRQRLVQAEVVNAPIPSGAQVSKITPTPKSS